MKHIESIQPEYAAGDLSRLLVSEPDATASAALSRLLHDWTGCAIPPLATTPQSEVEELVPLCLSILRRHWTTPLTALGDGTTPMSLADLMRRLIGDRVQGNEAWSIPAIHADIPTAVSALLARKIGGVPQAPDGISLVQLLTSTEANDSVTELVDDNRGWTMNQALSNVFPNLTDVELGCDLITSQIAVNWPSIKSLTFHATEIKYSPSNYTAMIDNLSALEEMHFPELVKADMGGLGYLFRDCPKMLTISFPKLEYISACNESCFKSATLKEIYMPSLKTIKRYNWGSFLNTVPALEKLVLGDTKVNGRTGTGADFVGCTELIHIEFAQGIGYTTNLSSWNPTSVLSDSERLPIFLSNFQTYIADRVVDRTGKTALTLTLSAAVYEALQAQEGQTILATLTNKNWNVAQA